jgi:8-oxo-dGTP pyrophosphatase MutT (NUDIX family)
VKDNHVLLVRARNNSVWYLPGGKIDAGEEPEQALCRELYEELGIQLLPEQLSYTTTVTGPSHDGLDQVTLICFGSEFIGSVKAAAEISEVAWVAVTERILMAPALISLFEGM